MEIWPGGWSPTDPFGWSLLQACVDVLYRVQNSTEYRVLVQGYYSRGILPGTKRGLNAWHCLSLVQQTFLNLTRGLSQGATTVLPASGTVSGPPDHHVLNKPEAQVKCLSSETEISSRCPCVLLLLFRWPFQNNFAGLSGQWADFLS